MTQLLNRFLVRLQADYRITSVSIIIDNAAGCAAVAAAPARIATVTPPRPMAMSATTALLQQRLSSPTSVTEGPFLVDSCHTLKQDHEEEEMETLTQHNPPNQHQGLPPLSNINEVPCTCSAGRSTCYNSNNSVNKNESSSFMKVLLAEHDCRPQGVQIVVDRTTFLPSPPPPLHKKCSRRQPLTENKATTTTTRTKSRRDRNSIDPRPPVKVVQQKETVVSSAVVATGKAGGGVSTIPITLDDVVDPHSRRRASPVPRTA